MTIKTNRSYVFTFGGINIKEFSEKEKVLIRQRLMENARRAFIKAGIKKTSIDELTRSVGIAKGSFYIFFKSKEALYFEILTKEIANAVPLNRIMTEKPGREFNKMFRGFLHQAVDSMNTNPILKLMLIPEEYSLVYRKIAVDCENSAALDIITPLASLIKQWKSEGAIIDVDEYLLANVIKCLFLLTTHHEEIGDAFFPDVMSYLIDVIADSFTYTKGSGEERRV